MTTIQLCIPLDDPRYKVKLIYLGKQGPNKPSPLSYLQSIRSGVLAAASGNKPEETTIAMAYHNKLDEYTARLASEVPVPNMAIFSPPSRFTHALPYREAMINIWPDIVDLTSRFKRDEKYPSGQNATSDEIFNNLQYEATGYESSFTTVLVVDDIFSRGRTVAAAIEKLRQAGVGDDCDFTVACPLWVDRGANA